MKKYKHISIPELTAIFNEENNRYYCKLMGENVCLIKQLVENSNDWKEIKEEPNYLITAFKGVTNKNIVFKLQSNGSYKDSEIGGHHSYELLVRYNPILSVKNSKGEEFTIGDNVKGDNEEFIVNSFEIGEHILGGCYVCGQNKLGNTKVSIELVEKCDKKPVFVSADCKYMFEGDRYYVPQIDGRSQLIGSYLDFTVDERTLGEGPLKFSTKEAAQEYIDNNKPKYSIVDIETAYCKAINSEYDGLSEIIEELKKLGK